MESTLASAVSWGLAILGFYASLGVLFSVPFVLKGVTRIDPSAQGGTVGFRLIILPGVVAFWPLLAKRWIWGNSPPTEVNAHRRAARNAASDSGEAVE